MFLSDKFAAGLARAGFGDLVLLFAASLFSLYTVIAKPLVTKLRAAQPDAATRCSSARRRCCSSRCPRSSTRRSTQVTAGVWFGIFWAIVVSSFVGWLAWAWVNSVRGIARSAPLQYLMPPIAGSSPG